jgi:single-strand DNA-binding protein
MANVFSAMLTLGRDAEVKYTPSGSAVLSVSGACSTGFGDRKQTLWIVCNLWGKRAEGELVNYCKKGGKIWVSGELSVREYEKDGQIKTIHELNCTVFELAGGKDPSITPRDPGPSPPGKPPSGRVPYQDEFEDDIPFS